MRWGALWEWADQSVAGSVWGGKKKQKKPASPSLDILVRPRVLFQGKTETNPPFFSALPREIMRAVQRTKGPQDRGIGAVGVSETTTLFMMISPSIMLDDSWNTAEQLGCLSWWRATLRCSTSILAQCSTVWRARGLVGVRGRIKSLGGINRFVDRNQLVFWKSQRVTVSFWIMDKWRGKETAPPPAISCCILISNL